MHIDTSKQSPTAHKIKNVIDFSHVSFEENDTTLKKKHKAYNIGQGKFISCDDLDKLSSGKFATSGCIIASNFELPPIVTGKITQCKSSAAIQQDEKKYSDNHSPYMYKCLIRHCTVLGCIKMFATNAGFQNHFLIGKHVLKL